MTNTIPLTVSPLPSLQIMNGGGAFCTGSAGAHIGLNYAISGITYKLYNTDSAAYFATANGANSSLDFGAINKGGNYLVIAQSAAGCTNTMTGTKSISENPLPMTQTVTPDFGGGGYCSGAAGANVLLASSENGVAYRLFRSGTTPVLVATKTSTSTGSPLTFGPYTTTGTYYITAVNTLTGCTNNMTGTVNISLNPLPIAYKVFAVGGGGYCANDTAMHIKTSGSEVGVNYTLYKAGIPEGIYPGTGDSLDLGRHDATGIYYVSALNATTTCGATLLGTATISINPLPTPYNVSVTGTGSYCAGGKGLNIILSGSNTGINYMLYKDNVPTGITLGGVGKALDFGVQTAGGVYTVNAFNTTTHCLDTMNSNGTITVIPLPAAQTLSAPVAKYCPGGTGADVSLTNSVSGFTYKLYQGGVLVDSMAGGASPLSFSKRKLGIYTATATDNNYGCVSNMTGNTNVIYDAVPTAYKVTGTATLCPIGFVSAPINLMKSDTGVSYQVMSSGSPLGLPVIGTGSALNYLMPFGSYTIKATDNNNSHCTNMMTDTAKIVAAVPDVVGVTISNLKLDTMKHVLCLGDKTTFSAKPVNGGSAPQYIWLVNSNVVAGATNSTFTYSPAGATVVPDTVKVLLTSNTGCTFDPTEYSSDTQGYVNVATPVVPSVTISSSANPVCKTSPSVNFTASATNQGVTPVYQWKKNGMAVGTNSASYSTTVNDSDVVFCVMLSSATCRSSDFVYSKPITERVTELVTPSVVLSADPGTDVQKGTKIVFSATVSLQMDTNGTKLYYTYQWYKNNTAITGATDVAYTTSDYVNNDEFSCTVTSHNVCGTATNTQQLYTT